MYVYVNNFNKQCASDCKKCETCCYKKPEGGERTHPCQAACANCMQCGAFHKTPITYTKPIPRDFLTLTNQPARNPYHPVSADPSNICNETCKSCDLSCMDDGRKQQCFECQRKITDAINKPKPYNPYASCFFHKHITEF